MEERRVAGMASKDAAAELIGVFGRIRRPRVARQMTSNREQSR